jgi:hypothetical protein
MEQQVVAGALGISRVNLSETALSFNPSRAGG